MRSAGKISHSFCLTFLNDFSMGSALAPIAVASTVLDPLVKHYETNRQMNFQEEQNSINRDWQTVEAEKARQFSAEQQQKAMDYNSPVYQANEFAKAGINPVLAMSGGRAVGSVSGGSAAPSAAPVGGVSPVQGQPVSLNIPEVVQSVGAFLKATADAKKSGIETDFLESTFFDAVSKFHNEQTLSNLEVASKEMDNFIKYRVKDAKIEHAWQELEEVGTRVVMNQASASESFSRSDLNKAMQRMNDALADYHGENALYVKLQVQNFYRDFESMLNLRASEAKRNRTQAAVNEWEAHWRKSTEGWRSDEFYESLVKLRNENAISNELLQQAKAATAQAKYAEDNKEVVFWKDLILDAVSAGTDIFNAYTHLKGVKAWQQMSDNQKASIERKIEQMRWEYGDKVEISTGPANNRKVRTYRRPYSKFGNSKD